MTACGVAPSSPENSVRAANDHGEREQWPRIDDVSKRRDPAAIALADAFGSLRTAVLFKCGGALPRSILVTSCRAGEGKTTVSVNLAISLARLGRRVLLVDADLRRPAVHRALGMDGKPGLVRCLTRDTDWRELVRPSPAGGLDVLPCGGATTRAGDLPRTSGRLLGQGHGRPLGRGKPDPPPHTPSPRAHRRNLRE